MMRGEAKKKRNKNIPIRAHVMLHLFLYQRIKRFFISHEKFRGFFYLVDDNEKSQLDFYVQKYKESKRMLAIARGIAYSQPIGGLKL